MSNWAIVIGIDSYVDWPEGALKSAVRDALLMRRWLLEPVPTGGGVPEEQIYTLLSPAPGSAVDLAPAALGDPTFSAVKKAIGELGDRTNAGADRCFFYFSGHGISNPGGTFGHSDAICFSDFSPAEPGNSLPTEDIFAKFRELPFKEQFFFIDACRDMPWAGAEPLFGRFGYTVRLDGVRPSPFQARLLATTVGSRAAEVGKQGRETGAFTSALLSGLAGTGSAKRYQPGGSAKYVVIPDSLFEYVRSAVTAMKLAAGDDGRSIQTPEMDTGSGGQAVTAPVLAVVPQDAVGKVQLVVRVAPEESPPPPPARIIVRREDLEVDSEDWTRVPITFSLPPREYGLATTSPLYLQDPVLDEVPLYDATDRVLRWLPRPPDAAADPAPPPPPPAGPGPPLAGQPGFAAPAAAAGAADAADSEPAAAAPPPPVRAAIAASQAAAASPHKKADAELHVTTSDSLAYIEITDSGGGVVAQGHGEVVATKLGPGFYRARLSLPYRKPVEKLVLVESGASKEVRLSAPRVKGRVAEELIPEGRAYTFEDGAVGVSEIVGKIAGPRIGTVLGLASVFADFPDNFRGAGFHLSTLGISEPFQRSSLHVVIVGDPHSLAKDKMRLRVSPIAHLEHGPIVDLVDLGLPAAVQGRIRLPAGQYGLHLSLGGAGSTILPVLIFAHGVSRVLIEVPADHGAITVIHLSKPGLNHDLFRQIDLLERSAMSGQLTSAAGLIDQLEASQWEDPAAYAVAGFVRLRLGQADQLRALAHRMTTLWPKVSDGWVLRALVMSGDSAADPQTHWMPGLEAGIPMVADTTAVLAEAADRYNLEHPNRELLKTITARSVPGTFWTAWNE